jgi:DNA helicase-2/ATP-dependent DNA helicase PcrA
MKSLNEAQKSAVETLSGPLLILAGAGAGKTKTLTSRIVNLIRHGASPSSILAITFTNKAAREMRERVDKGIREDEVLKRPVSEWGRPFVSTFHALGVYIIRENAHSLGLPKFFAIYDKSDSRSAIKESMKSVGVDPKEFDPGKIQSMISKQKGNGTNIEEYKVTASGNYVGEIVTQVWRRYEEVLTRDKALDFDDLLLKTLLLLEKKGVLERYQSIWKYIHIDEYQDTNMVQYRIANLLAKKERNLCVVGDIDQNIYSWRGARLRNILEFEHDYPEAKVVILEENYRSTETILNVANLIIKKNKFRKEKNLFTKNPTGENLSLYEGFDEISESEFVVNKSRELISSGVRPDDIAVLFRANFQSRVLEEAFLAYDVPYEVVGTRFFERKEIKDILSYIRAALDPESVSDIKRIINTPARGIGKVSFLKIVEGKTQSLPLKTRACYTDFMKLLSRIREITKTSKPSEIVKFVMKESGLEDTFEHDGDEGEERLENLREFVSLAVRYDELPDDTRLEEMLTDAALQSDEDAREIKDGVKIMTVHSSKGLEFDYVFITGLEDNLFPHRRLSEEETTDEESEEERRLFYVAITRARKKIFLSYSGIRTIFGSRQISIPSEFIVDIPDKFIVLEEGNFGLLRKPRIVRSIEF